MRTRLFFLLLASTLTLLATSCDDDKAPPDGGIASAKPQPATVKPTGAVDKLDAPEKVLAFGGANKLNDLINNAQGFIAGARPGVKAEADLARKGIQSRFRLKNADWLDTEQPARFAVVDPKGNQSPVVLVLAAKERAKVEAALPDDKKAGADGNAFTYSISPGTSAFVNFIDGFVAFSMAKDSFPTSKDFLVQLSGATIGGDATAVLSAKNAYNMFQGELDLIAKEARKGLAEAEQSNAMLSPDALGALIDWGFSVPKDIERVVVTATVPKRGARVTLEIRPRPSSELEKAFKSLKKRPLNLLARLPKDTPFAFGAALDPDTENELTKQMLKWSFQLSVPEPEQDAAMQAMSDYWKGTTGEMAFAVHAVPETEGLNLVALMGIRDAEKVREAQGKLFELYRKESVAKAYKDLGLEVNHKESAYKIGDVPVDTWTTKFADGEKANQLQANPAIAMMADLMTQHIAVSDDLAVVAYGKGAKAVVTAWLEAKVQGGFNESIGMKRALENAAPDHLGLLYVSPMQIVKHTLLGGKSPLGAIASLAVPKTGISASMGATNGVVTLAVDVPVEQAQAIMQVLSRAGGGLPL